MNPALMQQFIDNTLKFVEIGSFGMKRACDEIEVHRSMQKKASDLTGPVLDLMIKTGAVREDQRAAAAAMLGSHAETLQLLKNAVDELHKERLKKGSDLGKGVDEKQAGLNGSVPTDYDSLNDPFVGRKTSQKKASDMAMLAVLGSPDR